VLFGPLLTLVIVSYFVATTVVKHRRFIAALSDKRLKFTTELLEGVRIVKYYAWEEAFKEKIHQARDEELSVCFSFDREICSAFSFILFHSRLLNVQLFSILIL
jgi:ATP-binding cassette subfamily C (CFTR/MRP) protein 1